MSITKTLTSKFKQPKNIPFSIYPIEAIKGCYFYSVSELYFPRLTLELLQSEVFSFGKLLLDLFQFGANPEISIESYIMKLRNAPDQPMECPDFMWVSENIGGEQLTFHSYDMIVGCMQFDAEKRPTIERCEGILDTHLREYPKQVTSKNE